MWLGIERIICPTLGLEFYWGLSAVNQLLLDKSKNPRLPPFRLQS